LQHGPLPVEDVFLLDDALQRELSRKVILLRTPSSYLCLACKGGKMLCGKLSCSVLAKARSLAKHYTMINSEQIEGSTPPGVFVGRFGYPKVSIGPLIPPYHGNTEILDSPERWIGKSIYEIIDYRLSLVRGKARAHVLDPKNGNRLLDTLQELAMAVKPCDSEAIFKKKPSSTLVLSEDLQPFGPSASLRSFKTSTVKADRRIEKTFYDEDLKAAEATLNLYDAGVTLTRIQRVFSLGMLGLASSRRLVPTRWSITAVDSIISQRLIAEIKQYDTIDEFRVHAFRNLDNLFVAILMPRNWSFEWIEAWFPGTAWNEKGLRPALMGDYEGFYGRSEYASVGGCYYSCRLAVAEYLARERRQASALVLREVYPGYILPVGVWNVREGVRHALSRPPAVFGTFSEAVDFAMSKLSVPKKAWISASSILRQEICQRKISEFIQDRG